MTQEKNENKQDSCCHTGSCCGKKFIISVLLGLLLFGLGFLVGKSNVCPWRMCPMSQQK